MSKFLLNHVPPTQHINYLPFFLSKQGLGRKEEAFSFFNYSGNDTVSCVYHISVVKKILIFKSNTYNCGHELKPLQFRNIMSVNGSHSRKTKDSLQTCLALSAAPKLQLTKPPGTRSPPSAAPGCPTRNPHGHKNYNTHNSHSSPETRRRGWMATVSP